MSLVHRAWCGVSVSLRSASSQEIVLRSATDIDCLGGGKRRPAERAQVDLHDDMPRGAEALRDLLCLLQLDDMALPVAEAHAYASNPCFVAIARTMAESSPPLSKTMAFGLLIL